jgi:hypothetical protein
MTFAEDSGFQLIRDRLKLYRGHSEAWKDDHDLATACFELEELVATGIDAVDAINRADEWLRSRVASGKAKYDAIQDARIDALYQQWMHGSDRVIALLDQFEKKGFEVRGAEQFRRSYREVQGILTPDEKFFAHHSLVKLRDEAVDAHRRGETVEIKELSD